MNLTGTEIALLGCDGNRILCTEYPSEISGNNIFYIAPKKPCTDIWDYNTFLNAFALTYGFDSPETFPYIQLESLGPAEWVRPSQNGRRYYLYPNDIFVKMVEPGETSVRVNREDTKAVSYIRRFIEESKKLPVQILILGV
jgi:hypothetical protein